MKDVYTNDGRIFRDGVKVGEHFQMPAAALRLLVDTVAAQAAQARVKPPKVKRAR